MHFSLVKILPENLNSHGFDDAIFPLYFALKSLGYRVEILLNHTNPNSKNIIFGSCFAPRKIGREIPPNSIIFNLEQLVEGSMWNNNNYLMHLRDFEVWDYSSRNMQFFQEKNIPATYIPLGYTPEMSRLPLRRNTENDLLFYGLIVDRRDSIIKKLVASHVKILATQNALGDLRDTLLCQSKAVLNIHAYLPAHIEVVRLGYLWANRIPVISERRHDTIVPEYLEEACFYAPYEDIVEVTKQVIRDEKRLLEQAKIAFKAFSSKAMRETLRPLIGERNHFAKNFSSKDPVKETSNKTNKAVPSVTHFEWLIQNDMTP